jgi:hypothetical protein
MYNDRKDMPSLSHLHHVEKALVIICIMHNLLLSSLSINENLLFFSKIINLLKKINGTTHKIIFSYFLRDHILAMKRYPFLFLSLN